MKSLGISVNPTHWDFAKNQPKGNCPNRNLIKQVILKTEIEYQSKVLNKEIKNEEFTTSSLVEEKQNEIKAQTVEEFYLHLIDSLNGFLSLLTILASIALLNVARKVRN